MIPASQITSQIFADEQFSWPETHQQISEEESILALTFTVAIYKQSTKQQCAIL